MLTKIILSLSLVLWHSEAFSTPATTHRHTSFKHINSLSTVTALGLSEKNCDEDSSCENHVSRRTHLRQLALLPLITAISTAATAQPSLPAHADDLAEREAQRKFIQESYSDFTKASEGWLYREVTAGSGEKAKQGDRYVGMSMKVPTKNEDCHRNFRSHGE